ncbi:unnamed protein product [Ilex paraguariensis]|uniref:Uncharacterized protein n=1 Tax=Ilex paraguariensis TaxID=185542 RepID=A0ABC8QVQ0_9AQUA
MSTISTMDEPWKHRYAPHLLPPSHDKNLPLTTIIGLAAILSLPPTIDRIVALRFRGYSKVEVCWGRVAVKSLRDKGFAMVGGQKKVSDALDDEGVTGGHGCFATFVCMCMRERERAKQICSEWGRRETVSSFVGFWIVDWLVANNGTKGDSGGFGWLIGCNQWERMVVLGD